MKNDEFTKKLLDDIEDYGWHCVQVQQDDRPGYSSTVGLFKTHKHPELIVMGLPADVAHTILGMAVENIGKGHAYRAGQRDDTLVEGSQCLIRPVPPAAYREYFGLAVWYYRDSPDSFPAVQILWPDPAGRFPGEAGFEMEVMQPVLAPG